MSATLSRAAAHRIACAVVAAEVHRLRDDDRALPQPHGWAETLPIGEGGLGLDSLERLGALGALAEMFGLDDATLGEHPPLSVGAWVDWIMREHAAGAGTLVVRTSGSTGDPRLCSHAVATLVEEARFFATLLGGRRRLVAMVPAHHLYGIVWTALLPDALGIDVVTRAIGEPLGIMAGDLVIAVPDQWVAMQRLIRAFPADVMGVSSAGPLDDGIASKLLAAGLERLFDIYGSSETGGIAIRALPAKAYDLLPHWDLSSQGDDWQLVDDQGGRHDLPDHVERIGARSLRPTGRRDGAVQVGGRNVSPEKVAQFLRNIEGVSGAAVRLNASGRLKAFIVPEPGRDQDELAARIERAATSDLTEHERPKSLRFGPALPRNGMGKLEDWS